MSAECIYSGTTVAARSTGTACSVEPHKSERGSTRPHPNVNLTCTNSWHDAGKPLPKQLGFIHCISMAADPCRFRPSPFSPELSLP